MKVTGLLALSIVILWMHSCEKASITNPADPRFELEAPTLLSANPVTDTRIDLTWRNNEAFVRQFVVQRKDTGSYQVLATLPKASLSYSDTTCILDRDYTYAIIAKVESNLSGLSNTITAATEFPAPTNLSASSVSDSELRLTWTDNTGYESGFKIERNEGSGFTEIGIIAADVTEYTDVGLTFGQSHFYRVSAYTNMNQSDWATITAATEFPAPSNLTATSITDSELRLTWADNTSFESGFKIERYSGAGFVEIGSVASDVTEYTDTGLTLGQSYNYRLAAFTSENQSDWATVTAATEFPAPTNLNATSISDSELRLSWTDNTGFEEGFRIERDDGSGFTEIEKVAADVTEYTDTGLTFGQSYDYRVAAYTTVNTSSWATITAATEFPAPMNLTATSITDSELRLTWTDNTSFEEGFRIERDAGSGYTEIGIVAADVTEYTDTGLNYSQSYNYRVAAFTAMNTSDYSGQVTATACMSCVVDIDSNIYPTVQIGDQVWMAENLKVTRYRNGEAIPLLTAAGDWTSTGSGAMCYYANDEGNAATYGALYNWYAVDDSRNIAPAGWHLPTDAEWQVLVDYLGGNDVAGGKLKEVGTTHWNSPNTGATNESGFAALPGGYRHWDHGHDNNMGQDGYFWSATEDGSYGSYLAWYRLLYYYNSDVVRYSASKGDGFSVRCVRD